MTRLFQAVSMEVGSVLQLNEAASHHVAQVLRMQLNETVLLFNDTGYDFEGTIVSIKKNKVDIALHRQIENKTESPLTLHLCQALVRNEKMDLIIQKAVELGVTDFTPVETQHGQIHLSQEKQAKKFAHWQGIIHHATEQSGRAKLMRLHDLKDFKTCCHAHPNAFILHPESKRTLRALISAHADGLREDAYPSYKNRDDFCVLIGPEGGFSQAELTMAEKIGIQAYQFGPRVLRTETAGLAVMTYLQAMFGDLSRM